MTCRAFLRRRLIEKNLLVLNSLEQSVTTFAAYVLVHAFQRQRGAAVIEQRWFPLVGVVAIGAVSRASFDELAAVKIFVTVLADRRRRMKIHAGHFQSEIWWTVAFTTRDGTMRSGERKIGARMVECRDAFPVPQCCDTTHNLTAFLERAVAFAN